MFELTKKKSYGTCNIRSIIFGCSIRTGAGAGAGTRTGAGAGSTKNGCAIGDAEKIEYKHMRKFQKWFFIRNSEFNFTDSIDWCW